MAIPFGQPVDEISHGLEGIKIDGHAKGSGRLEVQGGSTLPSTDVLNGQILPDEGAHPSMVAIQPGVEHLEVEQIPGAPFSPFFHGPIYTGYPAPLVSAHHGFASYSSDGVFYPSPVVEYSPVYSQNFYFSAPSTVGQFNYGYGQPYAYPQYQTSSPVEQYDPVAPLAQDDGSTMAEASVMPLGFSLPYGYQNTNSEIGNGQYVPVVMAGPPPPCTSDFHSMPYTPICMPSVLNAASPAWVQQPMNGKGPNEESYHMQSSKSSTQDRSFTTAGSGNMMTTSDPGKGGPRVHVDDVRKLSRKQFGPGQLYGLPMPVKGAWVRAGHHLQGTQPVKPFAGKNKVYGANPPNIEQFNLDSFSTEVEDAKHFIIKSFSDENVYRSIQHGVWASTPHGNKKLDEAYKDAQRRAAGAGKAKGCPVFLYFSVNGSGRFCGVAEMTGPVDFNTTMEFWERNRWCGSFPVKWHFVKDIPHCQLRRIILQNNENKPVTSSRDTQEVNFEQGLQMLDIIKSFSTTASILDNFPVAAGPQKATPAAKLEQCASVESSVDRVAATEDCSVGAVLESSNALRTCNGETKARETPVPAKPSHGKMEMGAQDTSGDKENARIQDSV